MQFGSRVWLQLVRVQLQLVHCVAIGTSAIDLFVRLNWFCIVATRSGLDAIGSDLLQLVPSSCNSHNG